jgi:hypothetical protein
VDGRLVIGAGGNRVLERGDGTQRLVDAFESPRRVFRQEHGGVARVAIGQRQGRLIALPLVIGERSENDRHDEPDTRSNQPPGRREGRAKSCKPRAESDPHRDDTAIA